MWRILLQNNAIKDINQGKSIRVWARTKGNSNWNYKLKIKLPIVQKWPFVIQAFRSLYLGVLNLFIIHSRSNEMVENAVRKVGSYLVTTAQSGNKKPGRGSTTIQNKTIRKDQKKYREYKIERRKKIINDNSIFFRYFRIRNIYIANEIFSLSNKNVRFIFNVKFCFS